MPPPLSLPIDHLSGWATAPAAARLAGAGEVFRFFGSSEDALAFLHQATRAAARQARRRQRVKRHQLVVPIVIDEPILDTLISLRWLDQRQAESRAAIGAAVGRMLADLAAQA